MQSIESGSETEKQSNEASEMKSCEDKNYHRCAAIIEAVAEAGAWSEERERRRRVLRDLHQRRRTPARRRSRQARACGVAARQVREPAATVM